MEVVGETGGEDSGETIGTRHKAHLSAVPIAIGISEGGRGYRTFRMKLEIGLRRMISVNLSIQRNVPYL
jgi:hypothetical protein